MSWVNVLLPIVSAGVTIGQKIFENHEEKSKMQAAERQNILASFAKNPPKILDNYYATSRIENILNEEGVYGDEDSRGNRLYYRDEYYFAGKKWFQIFYFDTSGNLGQILLVHKWDKDLYMQVCQLLASTCSLFNINGGEYNAYIADFEGEDWGNAVQELEKNGLRNDDLNISYVDDWIFEYLGFLEEDGISLETFNSFIQAIPLNGRRIVIGVDEDNITLSFESANMLKNSQF